MYVCHPSGGWDPVDNILFELKLESGTRLSRDDNELIIYFKLAFLTFSEYLLIPRMKLLVYFPQPRICHMGIYLGC